LDREALCLAVDRDDRLEAVQRVEQLDGAADRLLVGDQVGERLRVDASPLHGQNCSRSMTVVVNSMIGPPRQRTKSETSYTIVPVSPARSASTRASMPERAGIGMSAGVLIPGLTPGR